MAIPSFEALSCILFLAIGIYLYWRRLGESSKSRKPTPQSKHSSTEKKLADIDPYHDVGPLRDFDWASTKPIKVRPFKPKFHLTMGLENCPLSEILEIDDTYLDRIKLRKQLLDAYPEETYLCNSVCEAAVFELFDWLMRVYLPARFPTMYKINKSSEDNTGEEDYLLNIPANDRIPLRPKSASEALYLISAHIDTDFLLLLPRQSSIDGLETPIYHLEAFTTCFPSGFRPRQKLSLPLAGIHGPVPKYGAKLEKSMDRFFARLESGRAVKRHNWTVTTDSRLFSLGGNHLYEDGSMEKQDRSANATSSSNAEVADTGEKTMNAASPNLETIIEEQRRKIEIENCRLRCERQTLHRLPKSGALCFTFKTYLDRLQDVKAEGSGPALAEAIDGMKLGSVPEMEFYKRGVVWGPKVKEYMLT